MNHDLQMRYTDLINKILSSYSGSDEITFSASSLPVAPEYIETDQIVIEKIKHTYNSSFRADRVVFYAHEQTYQYLGLLILSMVFHPLPAKVTLQLTHPATVVRSIVIDFEYSDTRDSRYPGYSTRPYQFRYSPREIQRHPWSGEMYELRDLPGFWLTNEHDMVIDEDQWEKRDVITGFGTDEGNVRLADLLLNMGNPYSLENEYVLEGDAGFRGVAPLSAEATFLLPSSFGWRDAYGLGEMG